MSYYFSKTLDITFEEAIEELTNALKSEGFGILTEIDVQATLKKKLDVDSDPTKYYEHAIPRLLMKLCRRKIK